MTLLDAVGQMFDRVAQQTRNDRQKIDELTALTERAGRATAPQKFVFANRPLAANGMP